MSAFKGRWYLNPVLHLLVSALLVSAAEVFLKEGAAASADGEQSVFGVEALAYAATWIGIAFYIVSFASWLHVLRFMPVSEAYALISIVQVLVPAAAWFFLHEAISVQRGVGIVLIVGGTLLVATSPALAKEAL